MQAGRIELELLAIRTLCAGKEAGLSLLNHLNIECFHYTTTKLMYRRLMARLKGEGHLPSWNDLLNDPTIPEERRQNSQRTVRVKKITPLITQRKGEALFTSLDNYRKLRETYELLNIAGNAIKQPTANIEEIIANLKRGAIAIDVNHRGAPITVDGIKSQHVRDALNNVDARIETGFREFDERSGGIPQGAVFLLGAESGQFKSVMALTLAKNIAKGKRTLGMFSLEMTQPENTQRLVANELEVNISDVVNKWQWERRQALKRGDHKKVAELDKRYFAWSDDLGNRYEKVTSDWTDFLHITCPSDEVDISWVLQQAEMSDREIIFIDYLGLLGGLSGDDQWRAMSNVARQCKIWTNRTGKTIILLAQMRFEEGKIDLKYSRAVKDHVNNLWGWTVLEVQGRSYLCVHQPKARGSKPFQFVLRAWPEFNKIGDLVDLADENVARAAIEDMKAQKDPAKRYQKAVDKNEENGRRVVEFDEDEPLLKDGGFSGERRSKSYDTSARENRKDSRSNVRAIAERTTASSIRAKAQSRTRAIALAKLSKESQSLSLEEAGIQAEEVIRRWEEASMGHRMGVDKLVKEILGLSQTKELLTQVKRLQGDDAARRKLNKHELAVHKAQVEVIKLATATIKTKGREYVSEDEFYAVDDLTLSVDRGEEPIASPNSLDRAWQDNAVAWADKPAITLPNSAKPEDKRWGANGDEESVQRLKRELKLQENSKAIAAGTRFKLKFINPGKAKNFQYLDDIQLDTAVDIAGKLATKHINDIYELADHVDKYVELLGPGYSRIHNRKHKRVIITQEAYEAACKQFGLTP